MLGGALGVRQLLAPALLSLLCIGVAPASSETPLEGEGRIVAIDELQPSITVEHGTIEGLRLASRTEFRVGDVETLRRARVGDRVVFTLSADVEAHGLLTIVDLRPAEPYERLWAALGARHVPTAVVVTLAALLLAVMLGSAHRLRRTVKHDLETLVKTLEGQHRLQVKFSAGIAAAAQALEQILRGLRADAREATARIRATRRLIPGEPNLPLVVVRTGEAETFGVLEQQLGRPGLARVILDRRVTERRTRQQTTESERRQAERRRPAPLTWVPLGYLIAEPQPPRLPDI